MQYSLLDVVRVKDVLQLGASLIFAHLYSEKWLVLNWFFQFI
jgi:hypothetical protein